MTVLDVLKTAETKKTNGNGKSKIPTLTVDELTSVKASRIRELKENLDSVKTELSVVEEYFLENVAPLREQLMEEKGYINSVKVPDTYGGFVTVVWSHAYSKIPVEAEEELRKTIPNFDKYFKQEVLITVKDCSEKLLTELIGLVGAENFAKFFTVERWIEPTTAYTEEAHKLPKADHIVRQRKPSVKTK